MNLLTSSYNRTFALAMIWTSCAIGGICLAQPNIGPPNGPPNGPPRGTSESREFWSILAEAGKEASNNRLHLWKLVEHPLIQSEIELSSEEFKSVEALNEKHMAEIRKLRDDFVKKPDKQLCNKELIKLMNQHDEAFTRMLSETCQFERLLQISVQAYGNRAAIQNEIASRIGLSSEKLNEIRRLSDEVRREEFKKLGEGKMGEIIREGRRVRDVFRFIDDKIDEAIKLKLTTQQLDALNQLKGNPFIVPDDLFDRRRRDGSRGDGNRDSNRGKDEKKEKDDCVHRGRLYISYHS